MCLNRADQAREERILKAFPSLENFKFRKQAPPRRNRVVNVDDDAQAGALEVYRCAGKKAIWVQYGAGSQSKDVKTFPRTVNLNGWSKCIAGRPRPEDPRNDDEASQLDEVDMLRQQQVNSTKQRQVTPPPTAAFKASAYAKGAGMPCTQGNFWNQCPKGSSSTPRVCFMLECPAGTVINDGEPLKENYARWKVPWKMEPTVSLMLRVVNSTLCGHACRQNARFDTRACRARFKHPRGPHATCRSSLVACC